MTFVATGVALLTACSAPDPTPPPQLLLPLDGRRVQQIVSRPLRFGAMLSENSGLAASARYPGVLYGMNDSGGGAVLYVLDTLGRLVNRVELPPGVENRDWEALALDGRRGWLYIGDVGNNLARRPYGMLYRLYEPAPLPGEGRDIGVPTGSVDSLRLAYPDGKRPDVEAIWVDEADGSLYLLGKRERQGWIYRVPADVVWNQQRPVVAQQVGRLPVYKATDASWNPRTRQLLVTTYRDVLLWTAPNASLQPWEATAEAFWVRLPWPREKQTEAVTWSRVAPRTFHTLSERGRDTTPHVRTVRLRPAATTAE